MSESISNERLSKRNLWGYSMGGIGEIWLISWSTRTF